MFKNHYIKRFLEGWRIFIKNPVGKTGIFILAVFMAMALASFCLPLVGPMYDPMTGIDPNIRHATPPSLTHFLGTDNVGRDIFAQLLEGAKVAFIVGLSSAFISIVLGTVIGMVAGYAGGIVDAVLMRVADIIMVMPSLVILLILASLFGQFNIWLIVFIIAIMRWPAVSRVIRSQTLSLKRRPFIEASLVAGASPLRIIFRHIMPNVLPPGLFVHDVQGDLGHPGGGGAFLSGIRGSLPGQLGHDAAMGLEVRPYVSGPVLADPAWYQHLSSHLGFLHAGPGHG